MTERVGLIGWPVAHSVSPAMHNAAFARAGAGLAVRPAARPAGAVRRRGRARWIAAGYRGFNVTIPHKGRRCGCPRCARSARRREAIGAVNTLTVEPGGTLAADNTDWRGFADDLAAHGVAVDGARCLVLGTGGSARAVVFALRAGGASAISSISRAPDGRDNVAGYGDLARLAPAADLIVNCTPAGMSPHVAASRPGRRKCPSPRGRRWSIWFIIRPSRA